jgi:hypothetical protein
MAENAIQMSMKNLGMGWGGNKNGSKLTTAKVETQSTSLGWESRDLA